MKRSHLRPVITNALQSNSGFVRQMNAPDVVQQSDNYDSENAAADAEPPPLNTPSDQPSLVLKRSNVAALRRLQQAEIRVTEALVLTGEMTLGLWDQCHLEGLLRSLAGALADLRQLERHLRTGGS